MRTKEQIREYNRKYYAANRDYMLQRSREWREVNPARHAANHKEWVAANPERNRQLQRNWYKRNYVSNTYDVPVGWYDKQLEKQHGKCAICEVPPKKHRRLVVDHDHSTGVVRALLCDPCNTALHKVETVKDWTSKASAYLEYHSGLSA